MRAMLVLFVLAFLGMAGASLTRHAHLGSATFDLGIQQQTVWLAGHGREPYLTTRGLHAFGDHFNPLASLIPASLTRSAGPLLVLQALLLAAGSLPVYGLARRQLSQVNSWLLALLYLTHPFLLYMNRFDFHFNGLFAPLALAALWALEARAYGYYALALALVLCTGESAGPSLLVLAVVITPRYGWRWGAGTALVALVGAGLALVSLRHFSGGESTQYLSLYRTPTRWLSATSLTLLATTLGCLGWLPLAAPWRLLPALPFLLGNLLSWRLYQHGLEHHYGAGLLPFLMWAALGGAEVLTRRLGGQLVTGLGILGLLLSLMVGPLSPWNLEPKARRPAGEFAQALRVIGPMASVSADNVLGAQLAGRAQLYLFPNPFQRAAWGNRPQALAEQTTFALFPPAPADVLAALERCPVDFLAFDLEGESFPLRPMDRWFWLDRILRSGLYGVASFDGRFLVLERGRDPATPDRIAEILRRVPP